MAREALTGGQMPEFLDQARLADPGLTTHVHRAAGCGLKAACERGPKLTKLGPASDEPSGRFRAASLTPRTFQVPTGRSSPLTVIWPLSSARIRSDTVCQTVFEINVSPGAAASARRAPRFTDWPVNAKVCPGPLLRLATTWPVAMPMMSLELPSGRPLTAGRATWWIAIAARTARSQSLSCATGAPKTAMTQSPVCSPYRAPVSLDLMVNGPKEAEHQLVQLFRVEPFSQPVWPDRSANSTLTCRRSPSLSAAGPAPAPAMSLLGAASASAPRSR